MMASVKAMAKTAGTIAKAPWGSLFKRLSNIEIQIVALGWLSACTGSSDLQSKDKTSAPSRDRSGTMPKPAPDGIRIRPPSMRGPFLVS